MAAAAAGPTPEEQYAAFVTSTLQHLRRALQLDGTSKKQRVGAVLDRQSAVNGTSAAMRVVEGRFALGGDDAAYLQSGLSTLWTTATSNPAHGGRDEALAPPGLYAPDAVDGIRQGLIQALQSKNDKLRSDAPVVLAQLAKPLAALFAVPTIQQAVIGALAGGAVQTVAQVQGVLSSDWNALLAAYKRDPTNQQALAALQAAFRDMSQVLIAFERVLGNIETKADQDNLADGVVAQIVRQQQEIANLKTEVDRLRRTVFRMGLKLTVLQKRCDDEKAELRRQLAAANEATRLAEVEVQAQEALVAARVADVQAASRTIVELQERVQELETARGQRENALNAQLLQYAEELRTAQEQLATAQAALAQRSRLSAAEQRAQEAETAGLRQQVADLTERVGALERELGQTQQALGMAQEEAEVERTRLEGEVRAAQGRAEELQKELDDCLARERVANETLETAREEARSIQSSEEGKDAEIARLRAAEVETKRAAVDSNAKVSEQATQLAELQARVNNLQREKQELDQTYGSKRKALIDEASQSRKERDNARAKLFRFKREALAEANALRETLERIKAEHSEERERWQKLDDVVYASSDSLAEEWRKTTGEFLLDVEEEGDFADAEEARVLRARQFSEALGSMATRKILTDLIEDYVLIEVYSTPETIDAARDALFRPSLDQADKDLCQELGTQLSRGLKGQLDEEAIRIMCRSLRQWGLYKRSGAATLAANAGKPLILHMPLRAEENENAIFVPLTAEAATYVTQSEQNLTNVGAVMSHLFHLPKATTDKGAWSLSYLDRGSTRFPHLLFQFKGTGLESAYSAAKAFLGRGIAKIAGRMASSSALTDPLTEQMKPSARLRLPARVAAKRALVATVAGAAIVAGAPVGDAARAAGSAALSTFQGGAGQFLEWAEIGVPAMTTGELTVATLQCADEGRLFPSIAANCFTQYTNESGACLHAFPETGLQQAVDSGDANATVALRYAPRNLGGPGAVAIGFLPQTQLPTTALQTVFDLSRRAFSFADALKRRVGPKTFAQICNDDRLARELFRARESIKDDQVSLLLLAARLNMGRADGGVGVFKTFDRYVELFDREMATNRTNYFLEELEATEATEAQGTLTVPRRRALTQPGTGDMGGDQSSPWESLYDAPTTADRTAVDFTPEMYANASSVLGPATPPDWAIDLVVGSDEGAARANARQFLAMGRVIEPHLENITNVAVLERPLEVSSSALVNATNVSRQEEEEEERIEEVQEEEEEEEEAEQQQPDEAPLRVEAPEDLAYADEWDPWRVAQAAYPSAANEPTARWIFNESKRWAVWGLASGASYAMRQVMPGGVTEDALDRQSMGRDVQTALVRGLVGQRGPMEPAATEHCEQDALLSYELPSMQALARCLPAVRRMLDSTEDPTPREVEEARRELGRRVELTRAPSVAVDSEAIEAFDGNFAIVGKTAVSADDDRGGVEMPHAVRWLPSGPHAATEARVAILEHALARCEQVAASPETSATTAAALRVAAGTLKMRQLSQLYALHEAVARGEHVSSAVGTTEQLVTRPCAVVRGLLSFPVGAPVVRTQGMSIKQDTSRETPLEARTALKAAMDQTALATAELRSALPRRAATSASLYVAPRPSELAFRPAPAREASATGARVDVYACDRLNNNDLSVAVWRRIVRRALVHLASLDASKQTAVRNFLQAAADGDVPGTLVSAADRRESLWSEFRRNVAISHDRLWVFVQLMSGCVGGDVNEVITMADEATLKATKAIQDQRVAIAKRVSDMQAKIVETVVSSMARESKLTMDKDSDDLVVIDGAARKELNDLASGESGRPFFEANVAVRNLQDPNNPVNRKTKLSDLLHSLANVGSQLQESLETTLTQPGAASASLTELSHPANSYFVSMRSDASAAIRVAHERLNVELGMRRAGRRVSLWELIEGGCTALTTRFAEFAGYVLVQARSATGIAALYVSQQAIQTNAYQARMALDKLVRVTLIYVTVVGPPEFDAINSRTARQRAMDAGAGVEDVSVGRVLALPAATPNKLPSFHMHPSGWGAVGFARR